MSREVHRSLFFIFYFFYSKLRALQRLLLNCWTKAAYCIYFFNRFFFGYVLIAKKITAKNVNTTKQGLSTKYG